MKKTRKIHNMDSLEKEIYRLKLEADRIEDQFDHNFDHLRGNYFSMVLHSLFHKKKKEEEEKSTFFDSFFKSEAFAAAINRATDHIAARAAERIESLVDKLFHQKSKS